MAGMRTKNSSRKSMNCPRNISSSLSPPRVRVSDATAPSNVTLNTLERMTAPSYTVLLASCDVLTRLVRSSHPSKKQFSTTTSSSVQLTKVTLEYEPPGTSSPVLVPVPAKSISKGSVGPANMVKGVR